MKRNLKALGLAVVAVFAMSAMAAQAASASPLFTSGEAHTIIKGDQDNIHVFEAGSGNAVECDVAEFEGTSTSTTDDDLTVTPTYDDCTAFGFVGTDVNFNGCDYLFTSTTGTPVHLNCPGSNTVTLTPTFFGFSVCTVKIPAGTFTSIAYDNVANGDVTVTANASGISYQETSGSCGVGSGSNGTYKGNATVAGTSTAGAAVNISVD